MIGHDRQQVVPGVDGVQSAPDDGEDDVDDGDYVHSPYLMMVRMVMTMVIMCTVRTTLSNGCRTGCRARDRAGCSTTPGPSQT